MAKNGAVEQGIRVVLRHPGEEGRRRALAGAPNLEELHLDERHVLQEAGPPAEEPEEDVFLQDECM